MSGQRRKSAIDIRGSQNGGRWARDLLDFRERCFSVRGHGVVDLTRKGAYGDVDLAERRTIDVVEDGDEVACQLVKSRTESPENAASCSLRACRTRVLRVLEVKQDRRMRCGCDTRGGEGLERADRARRKG